MKGTAIVVFGNAGHGKDTFAKMLTIELCSGISRIHGCCVREAFAESVKEVAGSMLGIPTEISHGSQEDKDGWFRYGKTAREWMQWIGTELGREMIHEDIWIHRMADWIKELYTDNGDALAPRFILISDGRFENERDELRIHVGEYVNVINVKIIRKDHPIKLNHPSESEVFNMPGDTFDYVVCNDGSLDELRDKAKIMAQIIIREQGSWKDWFKSCNAKLST